MKDGEETEVVLPNGGKNKRKPRKPKKRAKSAK